MEEWFSRAVRDALSYMLGWAGIILATLVFGFCVGFWIGHRGITEARQTLAAFLWLPVLWLGFPQMLLAYAVTLTAWNLPLRYDSGRLRIVAAGANLVVWLVVVAWVVEQYSQPRGTFTFFHFPHYTRESF